MVAVEIGDLPFPEGASGAPDARGFLLSSAPLRLAWQGSLDDLKAIVPFCDEDRVRRVRLSGVIFNAALIHRALKSLSADVPVAAYIVGPHGHNPRFPNDDFILEIRGQRDARQWRAFIMCIAPSDDGDPEVAELLAL